MARELTSSGVSLPYFLTIRKCPPAHLTAKQKIDFIGFCAGTLQAELVPIDIEALRSLLDSALTTIRDRCLYVSDQVKQQREEEQLERINDTLDDETTPQLSQIEVAGTTIMLSGEEAVLVVYLDNKWRGQKVEVKSGQDLNEYSAEAYIIARSVKDTIICAAIFPRLPILSHLKPYYENQKSGTYEVHFREYSTSIKKRNLLELQETVTLFVGNVAELDWRRNKY